jgi:hypothetical protein
VPGRAFTHVDQRRPRAARATVRAQDRRRHGEAARGEAGDDLCLGFELVELPEGLVRELFCFGEYV